MHCDRTVPRTPGDLRKWRAECCGVSQERLAAELSIGRRSLGAYERGELPIPPLLPWALAGILRPLRSRLRLEARRRRLDAGRRRQRASARREREQRRLALERTRELGKLDRRIVAIAARALRGSAGLTPEQVAELQALGQAARTLSTERDP